MCISVVILRGVLSELRNRDIDPDDVLRASGLSRERIMDLREYVTFEEADRLIGQAIARTNDPGLGLAVGARAPEAMLQVVGHFILAHRTVREAFASWQRCSGLVTEAANFRLLEQGELALFVCEPKVGTYTRFFVDLTFAIVVRIGKHFTLGRSELREVHFRYAAPSYAHEYRDVFECPVRFGRGHNALIFNRDLLDRPQLHADDTVRAFLNEAVDRLLQERKQARSLSDQVRGFLLCPADLAGVDAEVIARRLGVSLRTLRRRLGAEGTTVSTLLDEARARIACRALGRPQANVKEISDLLHFSEPSAFHRAFKRWTGRTPAEYARLAAIEHRGARDAFGRLAPSHSAARSS